MFLKDDGDTWLVRTDEQAEPATVSVAEFAFIASVRWAPRAARLILTGIRRGDRLPSLKTNYRGDMRLFASTPEGEWQQLTHTYSHDAVEVAGCDWLAYADGQGLAITDAAGAAKGGCKLGRFSWGPPSISGSPRGTRLGMVKWVADDRKLVVYDLATADHVRFRPSLYSYAWLDEDHVLYTAGSSLNVLDLPTGKWRVFLRNPQALLKDASPSMTPLADFLSKHEPPFWIGYDHAVIASGRVYFGFDIWHEGTSQSGPRCLISTDLTGSQADLMYLAKPDEAVAGVAADSGPNLEITLDIHDGLERVGMRRVGIGPDAKLIERGWRILPHAQPSFSFHWLPG